MGIQLADAQRVAIGCRACGSPNADAAPSTCNILDDHRLAKGCPHALADDARDRIRRPTCREWDDYCNGSRRKAGPGAQLCAVAPDGAAQTIRLHMMKNGKDLIINASPKWPDAAFVVVCRSGDLVTIRTASIPLPTLSGPKSTFSRHRRSAGNRHWGRPSPRDASSRLP